MMNIKLFLIAMCLLTTAGGGCEQKRPLPDVDPDAFVRYSQDNVLSSRLQGVGIK